MTFVAMMVLAFGPLNWSFPWWVWTISTVFEILLMDSRGYLITLNPGPKGK